MSSVNENKIRTIVSLYSKREELGDYRDIRDVCEDDELYANDYTIVYALLDYLHGDMYGVYIIPPSFNWTTSYINIDEYQKLLSSLTKDTPLVQSSLCLYGNSDGVPSDIKVLLIPVNARGSNHWSCYVWYYTRPYDSNGRPLFYYYDSLRLFIDDLGPGEWNNRVSKTPSEYLHSLNLLENLCSKGIIRSCYDQVPHNTHRTERDLVYSTIKGGPCVKIEYNYPKQLDDSSCGFWVIRLMEEICKRASNGIFFPLTFDTPGCVTISQHQITELRSRLLKHLIAKQDREQKLISDTIASLNAVKKSISNKDADDISSNNISSNDTSSNDFSSNDISSNDFSSNDFSSNDFSNNDFSSNDFSSNDISSNDTSSSDIRSNDISNNDTTTTTNIDNNNTYNNEVNQQLKKLIIEIATNPCNLNTWDHSPSIRIPTFLIRQYISRYTKLSLDTKCERLFTSNMSVLRSELGIYVNNYNTTDTNSKHHQQIKNTNGRIYGMIVYIDIHTDPQDPSMCIGINLYVWQSVYPNKIIEFYSDEYFDENTSSEFFQCIQYYIYHQSSPLNKTRKKQQEQEQKQQLGEEEGNWGNNINFDILRCRCGHTPGSTKESRKDTIEAIGKISTCNWFGLRLIRFFSICPYFRADRSARDNVLKILSNNGKIVDGRPYQIFYDGMVIREFISSFLGE